MMTLQTPSVCFAEPTQVLSHKNELTHLLDQAKDSFEKEEYQKCYDYCRDYLFLCLDNDQKAQSVLLMACRCIPHIQLFFFLSKALHQEFYDLCSRFLDQYPHSTAHDEVAFLRLTVVEKSLCDYRATVSNDIFLIALCDQFLTFYPQSDLVEQVAFYKTESVKRLFCFHAEIALFHEQNNAFLGAYFRWKKALEELKKIDSSPAVLSLLSYAQQHIERNLILLGVA